MRHLILNLLIGLFVPLQIVAQTTLKLERMSLFEKSYTFSTDSVGTIFQLPDSFLVADSDTFRVDSTRLLPDVDYLLNRVRGRVVFKRPLQSGKIFSVKYRIIPVRLPIQYFHRRISRLAPEDALLPAKTRIARQFRPASTGTGLLAGSELQKSGSIVRGISVGSNQGLKLDSGLRMQVSGRIADKVDVIAALTDQNTPIQPEGNTQSLQEIDKVFVQINSDRFQATLGDYELTFQDGEFGRYARKLQGAMGTVNYKNSSFTFSGAVSRGQYTTNQFSGIEGNQGPYQLKGKQGQTDIIVLAGTEKVWINGERMTRGENNDYVIEYGNGQITFTRNRLITDESRITVDFQYSDQRFRRNLYSGRLSTYLWDQKLQLVTTLMHEGDDKENPLDFTLSETNLNRLSAAGDVVDSAYVSSAVLVGANQGSYVQIDSAGIQFYRYVGADNGDYRVNFTFVGYGNGDYQIQGFGKYVYRGPGQGSYRAATRLYPAQQHNLMNFNLNLKPNSVFDLQSELALSALDQNTYSKIDDGDNQGFAYKVKFGIAPKRIRYLGRFRLQGNLRYINPQFQSIDRANEVEYNRRWDLGELATVQEQVAEISGAYNPVENWQFSGQWGQNRKGSAFEANRLELFSRLNKTSLPQYTYRLESIQSQDQQFQREGDWLRQRGDLKYLFWRLAPHFGFEQEIKKEVLGDTLKPDGFRFDQFSGGMNYQVTSKISVGADFARRDDKDWDGNRFFAASEAKTQNYRLNISRLKSLSLSMIYTHRNKRYFNELADKRADLAELKMNFSPFKRAITGNWQYQISNTQSAKRERQYLEVPQGEGSYRFDADLNEFVPDPLGNYEVRIVNTNIFIPVIELKSGFNLNVDLKKFFSPTQKRAARTAKKSDPSLAEADFWDLLKRVSWRPLLSSVSTETMLRLEERTKEKDVWGVYGLNQAKFRTDSTLYGTLFLRQQIYLGKNNRNFEVRLRFQQENTLNRQFIEGGEERLQIERNVRITSHLARFLSAQIEMGHNRRRRLFQIPGRESRNIRSSEISADLSFHLNQKLELALKSRLMRDVDEFPEEPTEAILVSIIPRANYSFRGKGRLSTQFEWSQVDATQSTLPYEMVSGNTPGLTQRWELGLSYRISKNMQGSLTYNGRNEKQRGGVIHLGRAEIRAFF